MGGLLSSSDLRSWRIAWGGGAGDQRDHAREEAHQRRCRARPGEGPGDACQPSGWTSSRSINWRSRLLRQHPPKRTARPASGTQCREALELPSVPAAGSASVVSAAQGAVCRYHARRVARPRV